MTSSRTPAAGSYCPGTAGLAKLMEVLEQVLDPRARRGVRHPCAGLVAAGIAAVSTGARSFAAIAEWSPTRIR